MASKRQLRQHEKAENRANSTPLDRYPNDDFEDGPDPCPMGCGGLTYDPAGGPCVNCWNEPWPGEGGDGEVQK